MRHLFALLLMSCATVTWSDVFSDINGIEKSMLEWRRHLHQNPELSNREFKTAAYIEKHLRALDMEVKTGIAFTGVVGILKGDKPGPVLALRADMDALPVNEQVDLSFASKVTTEYRGETTGVMHACGHDTHVAILMAVAELYSKHKADLAGTLMFIFQPAEEGAPDDEEGGAELMLAEGLFNDLMPEAVFGLHVTSNMNTGVAAYRTGPMMAAVDDFELKVIGKQAHGSRPWSGIDPIVTSAQIINSVQTIVSRKTDVTKAPAVVTFGAIKGGIRNNIIPDDVTMVGTIRNFDMGIRDDIHQQLGHIISHVAQANEADAEFKINEGYPVTVNDPELGEKMLPSLKKVFGEHHVVDPGLITGAEDFSFFANEVPGFYFFMGVTPQGKDAKAAPTNHSPHFYVDESALLNGVKAFVQFVEDY